MTRDAKETEAAVVAGVPPSTPQPHSQWRQHRTRLLSQLDKDQTSTSGTASGFQQQPSLPSEEEEELEPVFSMESVEEGKLWSPSGAVGDPGPAGQDWDHRGCQQQVWRLREELQQQLHMQDQRIAQISSQMRQDFQQWQKTNEQLIRLLQRPPQ